MILQKVIETSKAEILVIGGLPEDAHNFRIYKGNLYYDCLFAPDPFNLPLGKWQPLGFLKDITEDMAKQIIPYVNELVGYMDYARNNNISFDTATESFHSLIEANCKLKNKYGEEPKFEKYHSGDYNTDVDDFEYEHIMWIKEQSQVFTNPFLLKKV